MNIYPNNLSGLEILLKRAAGELPNPSMFETIPMKLAQIEKGRVTIEAMAHEHHLNPAGNAHGGFIASVMDSVMSASIRSILENGADLTTIELNVKYMKPVPPKLKIIAEGKLVKASKQIGVAEGFLRDESGSLYAFATTSCMIFR